MHGAAALPDGEAVLAAKIQEVTLVLLRGPQAPAFLTEPQYSDVFVAKARLITREADGWYQAPAAAEQSTAKLTGAMAA